MQWPLPTLINKLKGQHIGLGKHEQVRTPNVMHMLNQMYYVRVCVCFIERVVLNSSILVKRIKMYTLYYIVFEFSDFLSWKAPSFIYQ